MDTKLPTRQLTGRTAIITGASRGIGRALALRLAEEGMNLGLVGRDQGALAETKAACDKSGAKSIALGFDLRNAESLSELVSMVVAEFGALNVLINNAGVASRGSCDSVQLESWDEMLDINLRALMHLSRHALVEIEKDSWGAVINIASIMGKQTIGGAAGYCAVKHGVVGFSNAMFDDVRERGIKVCTICPGFVNTEMVSGRPGLALDKMIQPEDIAEAVVFVLRFADTGCPTEILIRPQRAPYT